MLWLRNFVGLMSLLWLVSACGFEPVYAQREGLDTRDVLSSIDVVTTPGRLGDALRAELEDHFNPEAVATSAFYRLNVDLQLQYEPFVIETDGTASRYTITLSAPYVLTRVADNAEIQRGQVRRKSSYNVSEQDDYSTFIAQQDALKRGVVELAEDLKMRLSSSVARKLPR